MKKLIALLLLCLPVQASAEVMHYSKCKTNEGKEIADVQTWVNDWRVLAKKNAIEYRVRLLLPHADSQLAADEFFIEAARRPLRPTPRHGSGGTPMPPPRPRTRS